MPSRNFGSSGAAIPFRIGSLTHADFDGKRYKSNPLAYLEIRDGKIWLLTDNIEEGIANELVEAGVSKDAIIIGFYSPEMREVGEFAVA